MSADYEAFLAAKAPSAPMRGLAEVPQISGHLMPHQRVCVEFALTVGGAGCYLDTGMGKTLVELETIAHAADATNGVGLILCPLAVAGQIAREAKRFGYQAQVIRDQSEARRGINICNYDRLDKLDATAFGAVALDESSILKNFTGKTTRALIRAFAQTRFKLAATATPAPNDHMELGQQCEFLGIMASNEMLMRWFTSDQTEMGRYRLKSHAIIPFWDWMASWSRMATMPSDLGGDDAGFVLPPLRTFRHRVENDRPSLAGLFGIDKTSATEIFAVKRRTAQDRALIAAELVTSEPDEPWVVWVDTDAEADAFHALVPTAAEVRGSHTIERKESSIAGFLDGTHRILLTKPSICAHGLNLQQCARTVFLGRTFSYEAWYQAVRRFWRFGQKRPVDVHIIVAEGEDAIGRVLERKSADHERMKAEMGAAMRRAMARSANLKTAYDPKHIAPLPEWVRSVA